MGTLQKGKSFSSCCQYHTRVTLPLFVVTPRFSSTLLGLAHSVVKVLLLWKHEGVCVSAGRLVGWGLCRLVLILPLMTQLFRALTDSTVRTMVQVYHV